MTVIINELEQVPPAPTPADTHRGVGGGGSQQEASPAAQHAQILTSIRREASRRARLWAD
jgi:hypothetical protein